MRWVTLLTTAWLAACGDFVTRDRVAGPAGTLALDDAGKDGPAVVLVHSLAGTTQQWSEQLRHLRQTRRAVAFDFRGHGRSDAPKNGDYTLAGMAADIAAIVDSLGLDRFVLIGHSMGGGAALVYAGIHPERVRGLVLIDPIGDGKQIPAAEADGFLAGIESDYHNASQTYWSSIAGPDAVIRERLLSDLKSTPKETVIRVLREVMKFDPDPALARYTGPKLSIVTPHNDMAFSLHRLGQGFPHQVVEGTGHWVQLDKPEDVNHFLDEFLEEVSGEPKR
jgi:pimeloyl-ACP methyl ester carboxylesterase